MIAWILAGALYLLGMVVTMGVIGLIAEMDNEEVKPIEYITVVLPMCLSWPVSAFVVAVMATYEWIMENVSKRQWFK